MKPRRPTALQQLAGHVSQAPLQAGPQNLGLLRDAWIDIYGCMLIGAGQPAARKTREALRNAGRIGGGAAAAPIFATDDRATAGDAAMANAVAGHVLEFDDWEIPGNTHVSVLLVPAILALSHGQPLSGRDAASAYLAGYETVARIGEAINLEHYKQGWHATATLGALGVAAAASRLLGLDEERTAHALAIACSRALGFNAQFGSDAKPLQVGFAVEGGILAARLAQAGLSGQLGMLEHETGMAALMGRTAASRIEAAFSKFGETPAFDEYGIVFKPWPCCGYTHRIMTGMLELRERGIDADHVDDIELQLPAMHAGILPFEHPQNRAEALFSLPYCAAMALRHGGLGLDDLERDSWRQDGIRRLIDITRIRAFEPRRPELNYDPEQPDRISVRAGGERIEVEVPYPLGTPQYPLPEFRLLDKFRYNAGFGDDTDAHGTWERLRGWTEADDVHELFKTRPVTG